MHRSKQDDENRRVQVAQVFKMQLGKLAVDRLHLQQQLRVRFLTHQATICGQARMISRKATTTITTARRTPTTISRAHRRICRVQIVEPPQLRSGVVTYAVRWFAMLVVCTSNCTVSIDHTRCVATQSIHADVVQRVISQTEEVRAKIKFEIELKF